MNLSPRGFIKMVTVVVVGVCVLIIVFAFFARKINPVSLPSFSLNPLDTGPTKTNPLLQFMDANPTGDDRSLPNTDGINASSYNGAVTLGAGNASYSIQPFEEYVTIHNGSRNNVDITGWVLVNSKGTRPIENSGNNYFYPTANGARIGQGTEFLDPSGNFSVGDIILKPGDEAVVTTGGPFTQYPFSLYTSFRQNICDGYLRNYPFEPQIPRTCPYPTNDPLIKSVTDECFDYMSALSRCENPEKDDKDNFDLQRTPCKTFMKERLNYAGCVAHNKNQSDFSEKTWRVFLGSKQQLWASQRETITLYDSKGNIVDRVTY